MERQRNELDSLLKEIEGEAEALGLGLFRAQPVWDDEYLTTVEWRSDPGADAEPGWRSFLKLAVKQQRPMLLQITHVFPQEVFDAVAPRMLRDRLDPEMRAQLEEHEHMLAAARGFANQTGKIQFGWIEQNVFYTWQQETDWYTRVWELVMSHPFEIDEEE